MNTARQVLTIFATAACVALVMSGHHIEAESIEDLRIVTEQLPPYTYEEDGQVKGLSTAVVKAVLQEIGIETEIRVYPWVRAYHIASKEKNVLIYQITRTEEREKLFKWVGIINTVKISLVKLKMRDDIQISTLDDVKKYRVGDVRGWVTSDYLTRHDIFVESVATTLQNFKKLKTGRIDLFASGEANFLYDIKQFGYSPNDFEIVFNLKEISTPVYMAFSRYTSDSLVELFRRGLEAIKKDGRYDKIHREYFK